MPEARLPTPPEDAPLVALLPWGLLYEDFLDTIGTSLDAFCDEMTGGYLFNYVDALRLAGVRSVIVLVSARVARPTWRAHRPTGAPILVLPPPRAYLALRRRMEAGAPGRLLRRAPRLRALVEEVGAYLSTPAGALVEELRRAGCGAILCQEYEYARFDVCVRLGRRLGVPVFATFQGANRRWGFLQRLARPRAVRRAAGLVIGPRREIDRVRREYGLPDARIARVFNPVDDAALDRVPRGEARRRLGLPDDARVVAWHGRVEREVKGLDVLMDAWERVCRARPDVDLRLLMTGTGGDAEWLRGRVRAPGVRGISWRDEYVHDRSVLRLALSAADVFAFPSRHEGFPVAPIEAMAVGLPVVAADAPGVPDILEGGEDAGGLVVPRGDAGAFAAALGRLVDDPELARRLGRAARDRVESTFRLGPVGERLARFLVERGLRAPADAEVGGE